MRAETEFLSLCCPQAGCHRAIYELERDREGRYPWAWRPGGKHCGASDARLCFGVTTGSTKALVCNPGCNSNVCGWCLQLFVQGPEGAEGARQHIPGCPEVVALSNVLVCLAEATSVDIGQP